MTEIKPPPSSNSDENKDLKKSGALRAFAKETQPELKFVKFGYSNFTVNMGEEIMPQMNKFATTYDLAPLQALELFIESGVVPTSKKEEYIYQLTGTHTS